MFHKEGEETIHIGNQEILIPLTANKEKNLNNFLAAREALRT